MRISEDKINKRENMKIRVEWRSSGPKLEAERVRKWSLWSGDKPWWREVGVEERKERVEGEIKIGWK